MVPNLEALGVHRMSNEERIALAQAILDSVESDGQPMPISDEFRTELRRRLAEYEANPESAIPAEEVEGQIRGRLKL
jgi:putative addiction module component (TIGR02574 family)